MSAAIHKRTLMDTSCGQNIHYVTSIQSIIEEFNLTQFDNLNKRIKGNII